MNENEKHILLFDGLCNLCNSMLKFTIKRDSERKFLFASLQSDSAKDLLKNFGLSEDHTDSFVLVEGDKYYLKSTAGLKVLRELGGIWRLMYVFIYLPRPIRDFIYDLIARSRYRIFGKRDTCMIPTEDVKDRFL